MEGLDVLHGWIYYVLILEIRGPTASERCDDQTHLLIPLLFACQFVQILKYQNTHSLIHPNVTTRQGAHMLSFLCWWREFYVHPPSSQW